MFYFSHNLGPDLEATLRAIRTGKVTDEEVNKLMTVFQTSGNFHFLYSTMWHSRPELPDLVFDSLKMVKKFKICPNWQFSGIQKPIW